MNQHNYIIYVYVLCSAIHCAGLLTGKYRNCKYTKPFLMPLLLMFYLTAPGKHEILTAAALTMGFLGDVFLMLKGIYLSYGILAFLIGHICYIALFLQRIEPAGIKAWLILPALIFAGFGVLNYLYLRPNIKIKKAALVPYIAVLLTMGFTAFSAYTTAGGTGNLALLAGALFFILSDTLLAYDLFVRRNKLRTAAVMAAYTMAQGLLVAGLLAVYD